MQTPSPVRPVRASSWIDRLTAGIDRLPVPNALVYGLLFVVVVAVAQSAKWIDRSMPPASLGPIAALMGIWLVLPLALMHYLDRVAHAALDSFRPAMQLDQASLDRWHFELTTMPALPVLAANLGGMASLWLAMGVSPSLFVPARTSQTTAVVWMVILHVNFALVDALIYHTLRQLRMVSRIYASATHLDVFRPDPVYAFSGLTARTGIAWALALYLSVALLPQIVASPFAAGLLVSQVAAIVAMFFLPLLGIHRRLSEEKRRLQSDLHHRLEAVFGELHGLIDGADRTAIDAVNKMIGGLVAEREVLAKIPTWPWQPGTLTAVISTLLIPVVLFLIQRLLTRILGF